MLIASLGVRQRRREEGAPLRHARRDGEEGHQRERRCQGVSRAALCAVIHTNNGEGAAEAMSVLEDERAWETQPVALPVPPRE